MCIKTERGQKGSEDEEKGKDINRRQRKMLSSNEKAERQRKRKRLRERTEKYVEYQ